MVCALYIPEVQFANVLTMEPIVLQYVPHDRFNKVSGPCCAPCQAPSSPTILGSLSSPLFTLRNLILSSLHFQGTQEVARHLPLTDSHSCSGEIAGFFVVLPEGGSERAVHLFIH